MAGTLVASNINDGTSTGNTTDMIKGSARAWVNFNGVGTVAIRASYNVSSITDNGVGDYTVNFSTAMPDANYSFVGSASGAVSWYGVVSNALVSNKLSGSLRILVWTASGATQYLGDFPGIDIAIFR